MIKQLNDESSSFFQGKIFLLKQHSDDGRIDLKEISPFNIRKGMNICIQKDNNDKKIYKVLDKTHMIYERSDLTIAPFMRKHNLNYDDFIFNDVIVETKEGLFLIRDY